MPQVDNTHRLDTKQLDVAPRLLLGTNTVTPSHGPSIGPALPTHHLMSRQCCVALLRLPLSLTYRFPCLPTMHPFPCVGSYLTTYPLHPLQVRGPPMSTPASSTLLEPINVDISILSSLTS
eukprot:TRINITY_DN4235_c0_g2_i3.p1 TRINITY_DN4235_c0_g2~~TRINITY_DN4235_c0_g2_i3.p1  ORF type:complete len:121 (-),score=1.59 TRINITY_DN4235_c0_g2_i3:166-528(-)